MCSTILEKDLKSIWKYTTHYSKLSAVLCQWQWMGKQQRTGVCIASNTRLAGCASGLFSAIQQGHPCCQVLLGMEEDRTWISTGDLAVRVSLISTNLPGRQEFAFQKVDLCRRNDIGSRTIPIVPVTGPRHLVTMCAPPEHVIWRLLYASHWGNYYQIFSSQI